MYDLEVCVCVRVCVELEVYSMKYRKKRETTQRLQAWAQAHGWEPCESPAGEDKEYAGLLKSPVEVVRRAFFKKYVGLFRGEDRKYIRLFGERMQGSFEVVCEGVCRAP